jgi:hypothetical protein
MASSLNERNPTPGDAWYRAQAVKQYYDEGFFEIDENAPVSQADGNPDRGAYVQAWVWIPDPFANDLEEYEEPNDRMDRSVFDNSNRNA